MNPTKLFCVFDQSTFTNIYSSPIYEVAIHEYLCTIQDSPNSNLVVVEKLVDPNKRYPFIINRYLLDQKTGMVKKMVVDPFKGLLSNRVIPANRPEKNEPTIRDVLEEAKSTIKSINIPDSVSIDSEIELQIEELRQLKEQENGKIVKAKEEHAKKMENYANNFDELNDEKRFLRIEKDRSEERKRIFESDKNVYARIKSQIEEGKVKEDEIPELFANKYPVFKLMDEEGELGNDDEYETYQYLMDEMCPEKPVHKKPFVPHNYHYLDEEEKKKYDCAKKKYEDDIENMCSMVNPQKKQQIPPYNELMDELDQSERDESGHSDDPNGQEPAAESDDYSTDVEFDGEF